MTFNGHRYFLLSQRYVKEKITRQIYWIIFDHVRADNARRKRFTNFMGVVFEQYVFELLRRIFPDPSPHLTKRLLTEFEYGEPRNRVKTVDSIMCYPGKLLLGEIKVSQLKIYKTGVLGDINAFREDINKIVLASLCTIQRTKNDFKNGKLVLEGIAPADVNEYIPMIVTYEMFPTHPLLWEIVEDVVTTQSDMAFDDDILDNLQIIEIDELETIERIVSDGATSLMDLIRTKNADSIFKRLPFSNYLHHKYANYRSSARDYLGEVFHDLANEMALKLFGQPIQ